MYCLWNVCCGLFLSPSKYDLHPNRVRFRVSLAIEIPAVTSIGRIGDLDLEVDLAGLPEEDFADVAVVDGLESAAIVDGIELVAGAGGVDGEDRRSRRSSPRPKVRV